MKLVNIVGPGAVGKMTVGQELAKITNLKLFHNHATIEPVIELFGKYDGNVIQKMRDLILSEFVKTDNEGIIFTFVWAFDIKEDWDLVEKYYQLFKSNQAEVYFIELEADQSIRLSRNKTPNRLQHKASKRDIEVSNQRLIGHDRQYRLNSLAGEIQYENYLRINNENLDPQDVAAMIKEHFRL